MRGIAGLEMALPYAQVNLFRADRLDFNLWTDAANERGLLWLMTTSRSVPGHHGKVLAIVSMGAIGEAVADPGTSWWQFLSPFEVSLLITAFDGDVPLQAAPGDYVIRFGIKQDEGPRPCFERGPSWLCEVLGLTTAPATPSR